MKGLYKFLILLGVLLICGALGMTAYNLWDEQRAKDSAFDVVSLLVKENADRQNSLETGSQSEDREDTDEPPLYELNPQIEMPTVEIDGNSYIGYLEIPALNMTLPIVNEWSYPNLKIAPCRYSGTAYRDNLVIAGHNYRAHFGPLNRLLTGDELIFTDAEGNVFKYVVGETEVIAPTAVEEMTDSGWDLSLFTCTIGGSARFTVRCDRIEE